jgi:hypothetical protein
VQVTGGIRKLAEDEDLVPLEDAIRGKQLQKGLELVVVLGLELAQLVEELNDLVQVAERVVSDTCGPGPARKPPKRRGVPKSEHSG